MVRAFKIAVICFFFLGALIFGGQQISPKQAAASISVSPSFCSNCPGGSVQCVTIGFPQISTAAIRQAFQNVLQQFLDSFTNWFDNIFNNFIGNLLTGFNDIVENQFIQWQDDFFNYELMPSLKLQMSQINMGYISSGQQIKEGMNAMSLERRLQALQTIEGDAMKASLPSPHVCTVMSMGSGNLGVLNNVMRFYRQASERMFTERGKQQDTSMAQNQNNATTVTAANLSNSRFTPGLDIGSDNGLSQSIQTVQNANRDIPRSYGAGPNAHQNLQWKRYCAYLADAGDNGGENGCGGGASVSGAEGMDIKPMEFLYNNYVVDVTQPAIKNALDAVKENLTGLSPPQLVPGSTLNSAQGRQAMMDTRSFIARQNAARSVVEFVSSSRIPTSNSSALVHELRQRTGIRLSEITDGKTSYREIMNALSNEMFATGMFNLESEDCKERDASDNIRLKPICMKRDSLVLSALYLMQLRDYYELMERGVLTLAVQTAIELGAETSGSEGGVQ